jgi:Lar family restriction alleviation protein
MNDAIKPLPCPFCGIGGSVWYIEDNSRTPREFFVECSVCYATGQRTGQKETAIVGWNRRAADPRLAELRAIAEDLAAYYDGARGDIAIQASAAFDAWKARNP